jgi:hypothetical protein
VVGILGVKDRGSGGGFCICMLLSAFLMSITDPSKKVFEVSRTGYNFVILTFPQLKSGFAIILS